MKKLYVIIRKDLKCSIPAVQAGHVVAEFCLQNPESAKDWNNEYLIYLQVKSLRKLNKWMTKLDNLNIPYSVFREPDLNDEPTAIATYFNEDTTVFRDLRLFK
jgi:peptidyl-tRNA hydrolase